MKVWVSFPDHDDPSYFIAPPNMGCPDAVVEIDDALYARWQAAHGELDAVNEAIREACDGHGDPRDDPSVRNQPRYSASLADA